MHLGIVQSWTSPGREAQGHPLRRHLNLDSLGWWNLIIVKVGSLVQLSSVNRSTITLRPQTIADSKDGYDGGNPIFKTENM